MSDDTSPSIAAVRAAHVEAWRAFLLEHAPEIDAFRCSRALAPEGAPMGAFWVVCDENGHPLTGGPLFEVAYGRAVLLTLRAYETPEGAADRFGAPSLDLLPDARAFRFVALVGEMAPALAAAVLS